MHSAKLAPVSWERMYLRNLLEVGLIDASFCARLAAPLAARLRQLLDTPE